MRKAAAVSITKIRTHGTANLFMSLRRSEGWRNVKVTDRHTAVDYACVLKELADVHSPRPRQSCWCGQSQHHTKASLYEAFPLSKPEGLERFEFHYTPKHGSWLDMAESELGVLATQCSIAVSQQEKLSAEMRCLQPSQQTSRQGKLAITTKTLASKLNAYILNLNDQAIAGAAAFRSEALPNHLLALGPQRFRASGSSA